MSLTVDLTDTSRMTTTSSEDSDSEYDAPHAPYTRSPLDAARGGIVRKPVRRVRKDAIATAEPRIVRKKKHTKASTASRH
jgi:hypothetical protein